MAGQQDFGATVSAWCQATEQRLTAVFRESAQRTFEMVLDETPVDTGFLKSSFQVSTTLPPPRADEPQAGRTYVYDAGPIVLAIAGASLGDCLFGTFSASYSAPVEYGSRGRAGVHMVGRAAQAWQVTVAAVCNDLQAYVAAQSPSPSP